MFEVLLPDTGAPGSEVQKVITLRSGLAAGNKTILVANIQKMSLTSTVGAQTLDTNRLSLLMLTAVLASSRSGTPATKHAIRVAD